jgi:AraC family transcriptional regulator of adaptative response/methylated-DNA-[protein]-cysteine methyltransferase
MDLWLAPHDFRVRSLKNLAYSFIKSPIVGVGDCMALATDSHLVALYFVENRFEALLELQKKWPKAKLHRSSEVEQFMAGAFEHSKKIPLLAVGTPFQLSIWEFLRSIPSGKTMTYGEVAQAIGRPRAARAVGQAVGANEIAVMIPCHRVVSQGKLTGYRWGLDRKKKLLDWELSRNTLLT